MNFFFWRERNQHERLDGSDHSDDDNSVVEVDLEENTASNITSTNMESDRSVESSSSSSSLPLADPQSEEEVRLEDIGLNTDTVPSSPTTNDDGDENGRQNNEEGTESPNENDENEETSSTNANESSHDNRVRSLSRRTLADLEEEREAVTRRTTGCVLVAVFILFRLWVEAFTRADLGLLLICLVGTSWTGKWIGVCRAREEELDRRIAEFRENEGSRAEIGLQDLQNIRGSNIQMLSFQSQIALAILESQRQMNEGNFGHPDGHSSANNGTSEKARLKWERYCYKSSESIVEDDDPKENTQKQKRKGSASYGSVPQEDGDDDIDKAERGQNSRENDDDDCPGSSEYDLPHCSICLCEYENGDDVVRLPCGHIYHDDCVSSWCCKSSKCPLCNFDLESVLVEESDLSKNDNDENDNGDNEVESCTRTISLQRPSPPEVETGTLSIV